ncbi:MAG TPA: tRNA epoxyqueuosine(34) reductase QueG, partial [Candidatus Acidoferrum sp.]
MPEARDTVWITERARAIGFDLCGVVRAEGLPELQRFQEWIERGYAGEMRYLEDPRRQKPELLLENVRSIIVCALNYNTPNPYSTDAAANPENTEARGWISRYAWGRDYHEVMWAKLNELTAALRERFAEPFVARAYADTGPLAERVFAKHAGLGWLGKNTLLLNESLGSWLFLGAVATSLDLETSLGRTETPPPDLCGNCRQCLDACPTGALVEPYVMDARRCISYLTIELRGSIPQELREPIGWQVYGCDICQDVCPVNHRAPAANLTEFQPRAITPKKSLLRPPLEWLASMEPEEFREVFRGSAIKRTKWAGLVRNACIALGNAQIDKKTADGARIVSLLLRLAQSPVDSIAESAQWALSR